jgi:hypothetical protein
MSSVLSKLAATPECRLAGDVCLGWKGCLCIITPACAHTYSLYIRYIHIYVEKQLNNRLKK